MTPAEKYRILQRLGNQQRRKFSDVFLAEDKTTGEQVVLKVLEKTASNTALQERLRAEATFRFGHPQLPSSSFIFESESELITARTFVEGQTLDNFMRHIRRGEKGEVLRNVLREMVPVFKELREQHIVHLDIKPSNIIIRTTASGISVHLIDFGMAMRTTSPETRKTLFPLGYAAPELLLNRLHLADQRTDLFALGITFWQQFTGKLPLLHSNPGITTNLQLTHPLPDHELIPSGIYPILLRMCSKHSFGIPPNQLEAAAMDESLIRAMNERYPAPEAILSEWDAALAQRKKSWFTWKKRR